MRTTKIVGNLFLIIYIWVTFWAFILTVLDIRFIHPRNLVVYAYGMMAPYQSYNVEHGELRAEGLTAAGEWERVDLDPYYPVLFGEQNAREFFSVFGRSKKDMDNPVRREAYADVLRQREMEQGRTYTHIKLWWETWPGMTGDYHANKFEAATNKFLVLDKKYE